MPNSNSWIVHETTGRWAAALRVVLAKSADDSNSLGGAARIRECRSVAEFAAAAAKHADSIAMMEVRPESLATALETIAEYADREVRLVALLDGITPADRGPISDALFEAGALAVLESPRRIGTLLSIARRRGETALVRDVAPTGEPQSFAARAWAALPWQDE